MMGIRLWCNTAALPYRFDRDVICCVRKTHTHTHTHTYTCSPSSPSFLLLAAAETDWQLDCEHCPPVLKMEHDAAHKPVRQAGTAQAEGKRLIHGSPPPIRLPPPHTLEQNTNTSTHKTQTRNVAAPRRKKQQNNRLKRGRDSRRMRDGGARDYYRC